MSDSLKVVVVVVKAVVAVVAAMVVVVVVVVVKVGGGGGGGGVEPITDLYFDHIYFSIDFFPMSFCICAGIISSSFSSFSFC